MEEKNQNQENSVNHLEAEELALASLPATAEVSSTSESATADEKSSSAESGNLGSYGTYNVNLISGLLNLEMKDFAWEGSRMPVTIKHSYHGKFANATYGTWETTNGSFTNMKIGWGWRLNLMQSMVPTGINTDGKNTYTYTDESGETTVFVETECESGSACGLYADENDMGYTYNAEVGILKKGEETHTFSGGRLTKIVDAYGNTMEITYTSGRITRVTDGVGRAFTFGYNANTLASIVAPNNSSIEFGYCEERLCCVTFPNGQRWDFAYQSGTEQITEIAVSNGLTTYFERNSANQVTKIGTIVNDTASGKYATFSYVGDKQTTVTEIDPADGDDLPEVKLCKVYLHDHPDKNYSYYDAGDDSKTYIPSGTSQILPYTEAGGDTGNLQCLNLLQKHAFDTTLGDQNSDYWYYGWESNLYNDNNLLMIRTDDAEGMPGGRAAYLINPNINNHTQGMWQTLSLEAGSYVFSCYLKLIRKLSTDAGVKLMVHRKVNDTTWTHVETSEVISETNGFSRVAMAFNVSTAGTYRVGIYLDYDCRAKAIAPQLEQGNYLSTYNYVGRNHATQHVNSSNEESQVSFTVPISCADTEKDEYTLSGKILGNLTEDQYAEIIARIYYKENATEGTPLPSEFSLPLYSRSASKWEFFRLQFEKDQCRTVDHMEIICRNENATTTYFSTLQLVRNTHATGLSAEDFAGSYEGELTVSDESASVDDSYVGDETEADGYESLTFQEVKDAFGNTLTSTNFQNGEWGAVYTGSEYATTDGNAGNNKTEEIDARGNVTAYEYNLATSKPTRVTDRCGNVTTYTYDVSGNTTGVISPNSATVAYSYNDHSDLTQITRGDGQSYTMHYDAYCNLTQVKVGGQNLVTYGYKSGGNRLKTMTYGNGSTQSLTYDRYGNIVGETWTKNGTTEAKYRYCYDEAQNLVKTIDILSEKLYNIIRVGENVTAIEEYDVTLDASNVVTAKTLVGTMKYSFDSDGKQFRKKYVAADGTEQKYLFEYRDEENVAVQLPTGIVSHAKSDGMGRKIFDELQLGKGLMSRRFSYYDGTITDTHTENDKCVSAPTTMLVKQIAFADGRTIVYEYDNEERITKVIDSVDGTYEYTYDAVGQLLIEKRNGTTVNTMTYDGYGNIKTKNGISYGYDGTWKDKLTSYNGKTLTYDANGNPTNYMGTTLVWEKGRQLKQFGANTYTYNNHGIRTSKTVNGVKHTYTLEGTNIVKETWGSNTLIPLYDLDGTVCGIQYNGVAYYFYKNLQGDVIAITDNTGTVVANYRYDAWGACTILGDSSCEGIATINPFRYRGYYYDIETKLYYLQSRYYDSSLGRFLNMDKIEYTLGDNAILQHNGFAYCLNNVVSKVDTMGNQSDYIDNQEDPSWKNIKVGFWGNVRDNGCGAIAIYNILHSYSPGITIFHVLSNLRWKYGSLIDHPLALKGLSIYNNIGLIGIAPTSITNYLKSHFFFTYVASSITYLWGIKAELSGGIIVLYQYKGLTSSLHYVAGIKTGDGEGGSFRFYNDLYYTNKYGTKSISIWKYIDLLKEEGCKPIAFWGVAGKKGRW